MRTLILRSGIEHWSLTTLREKLVKIGAGVVRHGRYATFQLTEFAMPRDLFEGILQRIQRALTTAAGYHADLPLQPHSGYYRTEFRSHLGNIGLNALAISIGGKRSMEIPRLVNNSYNPVGLVHGSWIVVPVST